MLTVLNELAKGGTRIQASFKIVYIAPMYKKGSAISKLASSRLVSKSASSLVILK